jgi:hypothetical protein
MTHTTRTTNISSGKHTMPVLHKRCRSLLLILLLGIWGGADFAHTQELGLFRLRRWNGSIQFRLQREERLALFQARERSYNGTFIIRNSGFVINPDVLSFRWSGDLILFLEQFITEDLQRNSQGRFLGQSFTATLFQSSPNSLAFLWNRNANVVSQDFSGRTNYDVNNIQAELNMRGSVFPSRLQVAWRDLKEEWDRAGFQATRNQLRRSLQYDGKRIGEASSFEVNYDFIDIQDRIRSTWSYSWHTANMRYRRAFGEDRSNIWDSKLRLLIRKGVNDNQNVRLNQSLRLQHLPSLSSRYRHALSFSRSASGTILQNTATASVLHRLYSSLSTNLGVGGTQSIMHNGNIYTFSVSGGINYTKKIPLSGRLQIGYTRGYSMNDLQIEATEQYVADERHVFIGGFPVRLNERNVIVSTIVVFDEQAKFIFEEGEDKDYTLRVVGEYVEIHRNPFGRIREDDVVLVNYRFRTLPAMRYSTNSNIFNAGISFGWLSISYHVNRHDQNLLDGDPQNLSSLQDLFTKAVQLQVTLRGDNAGTSLFAERKSYESRSLAFKALDIRYGFFLKPLSSITLTSNFTFSLLNHQRENLDIEAYAIRSELHWRPSYSFTLQGYGKYLLRQETIQADESTFEFGIKAQRLWRVFRLLLMYDKRKWEFGLRNIDERRFTFEIERIF